MKQREIRELLKELNFNIVSKGFPYWVLGLKLYTTQTKNLEHIYVIVANEFNTTKPRVEKAMRHACKDAKENIKKLYNYNGAITTKVIMELLTNFKCNM